MSGILDTVNLRTQMVGQNRLELLLFGLETEQIYGINVFKVREVLQCPALTEVPRLTTAIKGMAHIRGETIPVLDLSEAIGRPSVPKEELQRCFLIVAEYNKRTLAFLVRKVDRILNTHWDQIMAPPAEIGVENYLTAVFEHDGKLIEILDVEQILADLYPMRTNVSEEIATKEVKTKASEYHILCVDDSSVARNQMQRSLEDLGIKVTTCNNGRAAWNMLNDLTDKGVDVTQHFLMMISDIEMPEMDGYTLAAMIREDTRMDKMHIVLHSSLSGGFNVSMVKKVGADGFLAKFNPDDLAGVVVDRIRKIESRR
ncbi:chemotaxis protein CheV [Neptunomonas phycophila]|jgi:two-component system chemotaxis response regulator CheV|uniref:Chemotaxis protein CheV n=1 Tax=Neptunomonas phycophila TaxID=1572645 RepID=A0AAW7XR01_9GAMM|nr:MULTISPECIES: chemotaxis protein CheV [Neptunomonas]MBT3144395.1 chemotaxis protein CheV [Neptunomonas phycophila]MDN2660541.1 chemotaxis protein CheV [Neptunomonas sp. CHC150]MDO6455273.1 chemotaxis protein CheV [Neptunomonas phycophila]MDO6469734.1 chemotaxis protein CheV [Neptunomonas phycophila]MDO6785611.1 chemotaxis protein CheV [Neptunomonas phycophila]